jgi:hypothetical protein
VVTAVLMESSSSAPAPVDETSGGHILYAKGQRAKEAGYYELQWKEGAGWSKKTVNEKGTTGWAQIIHSTNAAVIVKSVCRVHLCAFSPCKADWKGSKYGNVGPPIHLVQVQKQCHSGAAVAEPSGPHMPAPAAAQAAASGPSDEASSSAAEPTPAGPAPAAGPSIADEPGQADAGEPSADPPKNIFRCSNICALCGVDQCKYMTGHGNDSSCLCENCPTLTPRDGVTMEPEVAKVPDCPKQAALQNMKPPAPAAPIHESAANVTAAAVAAAVPAAVAAQHTIQKRLLALSREIRKPKAYVGYSAFILMGLLKKCRPCAWEGSSFIDLLEVFAPWALEHCTAPCPVRTIPCALVAQADGSVELAPISEEHPLSRTCHFVAGHAVPESAAVAAEDCSFRTLYASLGVSIMISVLDGDCALDVMTMMLGIPPCYQARSNLRRELSDYLIERLGEPWLHDIMVACQELDHDDVNAYRSADAAKIVAAPSEPAPAVEDPTVAVATEATAPDEETFAAMRWASKLSSDACVLGLIRSLPKEIVEEQVCAYRRSQEAVVAADAQQQRRSTKITISLNSRLHTRMMVAQRFHMYCQQNRISVGGRMPYGTVATFIKDNIEWKGGLKKLTAKQLRGWHTLWLASTGASATAVAVTPPEKASDTKSLLRSRAPVPHFCRRRAAGGGRKVMVSCVRQALYEWFTSIRYAIDWKELIAENRSRGKKHLARFPRAFLKLKAEQLLQDYCYACMLNGTRAVAVKCTSWWFRRWEEEYGLSMKMANRKYAVPRHVVKERLEIFWVTMFRVRYFIWLVFGYEPDIMNPDQSPFHHNETGSQNRPTLAVRGSTVPVVEGNDDCKSRWTGFFTTESNFAGRSCGRRMPAAECMFKAEKDGAVDARLQNFIRSRGFPEWFTVTVGPKGSYREYDIVAWLRKHLEEWREGRDWRVILLDDYVCHRTENVWNLCWSRGYVRVVHGGGTTPIAQTPDTDLNEHVRRAYGDKESRLLLDKMRAGGVVPRLSHEECMMLLCEVLSDPHMHTRAAAGYKKVGQTIDLHGKEDELIEREARTYWNEKTTDGFPSMRPKIDSELSAVADEHRSGGIVWCERDVRRLIGKYPARARVDKVLQRLGEDFYHDDVHRLQDGADAAAVAAEGDESSDDSMAGDLEEDDPAAHALAAVAAGGGKGAESAESSRVEPAPLSTSQADAVHAARATAAALQSTIESLRAIGHVRGVQVLEVELAKERRRVRALVKESPAVADAFLQLRRAEEEERCRNRCLADKHAERKRDAAKALQDRNAAVAELRDTRRKIQELEGIGACKHAMKSFTLEALGQGSATAGGAKARKSRLEVLDRLARIRAGLSPGQKNDWGWFKEAWDKEMVKQHKDGWAKVFAEWMQNVLEDERSNAFSAFVYKETCRVFSGTAALHVPGG